MARTTIDLDPTVLHELKRRQAVEGKTLGQLASELLASALANAEVTAPPVFEWQSAPMHARVDLEDDEAVRIALGGP